MKSDSPEVTSSAAWLNANVQASDDANHNISSSPIYALNTISDSLFDIFHFSNIAVIYSYAIINFLISLNNKTINSLYTRRFKRDVCALPFILKKRGTMCMLSLNLSTLSFPLLLLLYLP